MPQNGTVIERAAAQRITPQEYCRRAVALFGNVHQAALKLQVSRNTILYWLNKPDKESVAEAR